MFRKIKLPIIVFDFGGVLLDWNIHYLYDPMFNGDADAVDAFLEEIEFAKWNAMQDAGRPFALAVEEHIKKFPQHAEFLRAYNERWMDSMGDAIQPVVDIMMSLKKKGYSIYGLTNWNLEKFNQVRPLHPFLEELNDIVVSGEEKIAKPDPRIFQILLERVQHPASECLLIDDSPKNIAVAQSLGFQTILFQSHEQLKMDLGIKGVEV